MVQPLGYIARIESVSPDLRTVAVELAGSAASTLEDPLEALD